MSPFAIAIAFIIGFWYRGAYDKINKQITKQISMMRPVLRAIEAARDDDEDVLTNQIFDAAKNAGIDAWYTYDSNGEWGLRFGKRRGKEI